MAHDNPNLVIAAFAIFCSECGNDVRTATPNDWQGDIIWCPKCNTHSECLVGLRLNASTDESRARARRWLDNDPTAEDLLFEILQKFHRKPI